MLLSWFLTVLLVHSVVTVDLYKSKRVPRQPDVFTPYSLNHPPSVESYIPVSVVYDDPEDIPVRGKSVEQQNTNEESNEGNVTSSIEDNSNQETSSVDPIPVETAVTDTEKNIKEKESETFEVRDDSSSELNNSPTSAVVAKPKGRSFDISAEQNTTTTTAKESTSNRTKLTRKRVSNRVRKIKVNSTQTVNNIQASTEKISPRVEVKSSKVDNTPVNNVHTTKNTQYQKRTQQRDPVVPIIESENFVFAFNGDYHYSYEGGDGTKAFERGEMKTSEDGSNGSGVVGGFSYTDKDGNDFSLSYTADENGYRPIGAHLPTPPPIPPAIQRALELLATKTTPEPITEKSNKYN